MVECVSEDTKCLKNARKGTHFFCNKVFKITELGVKIPRILTPKTDEIV